MASVAPMLRVEELGLEEARREELEELLEEFEAERVEWLQRKKQWKQSKEARLLLHLKNHAFWDMARIRRELQKLDTKQSLIQQELKRRKKQQEEEEEEEEKPNEPVILPSTPSDSNVATNSSKTTTKNKKKRRLSQDDAAFEKDEQPLLLPPRKKQQQQQQQQVKHEVLLVEQEPLPLPPKKKRNKEESTPNHRRTSIAPFVNQMMMMSSAVMRNNNNNNNTTGSTGMTDPRVTGSEVLTQVMRNDGHTIEARLRTMRYSPHNDVVPASVPSLLSPTTRAAPSPARVSILDARRHHHSTILGGLSGRPVNNSVFPSSAALCETVASSPSALVIESLLNSARNNNNALPTNNNDGILNNAARLLGRRGVSDPVVSLPAAGTLPASNKVLRLHARNPFATSFPTGLVANNNVAATPLFVQQQRAAQAVVTRTPSPSTRQLEEQLLLQQLAARECNPTHFASPAGHHDPRPASPHNEEELVASSKEYYESGGRNTTTLLCIVLGSSIPFSDFRKEPFKSVSGKRHFKPRKKDLETEIRRRYDALELRERGVLKPSPSAWGTEGCVAWLNKYPALEDRTKLLERAFFRDQVQAMVRVIHSGDVVPAHLQKEDKLINLGQRGGNPRTVMSRALHGIFGTTRVR